MDSKNQWLKVAEVAEQLGVSGDRVRGWIAYGHLAAINVASKPDGRASYRISVEAVESFVKQRTVSVTPTPNRRRRRRKARKDYYKDL